LKYSAFYAKLSILKRQDKAMTKSQTKSKKRVADHGEVFTAEREVNAMLDLVKQETERIDSRFLEPACGDGNFLAEILRRTAFIHGADLSTVVMSLACIETYFKTENPDLHKKSLFYLIDTETALSEEERQNLHKLRHYRNRWVHMYDLDDDEILNDETSFIHEAEEMACLAVKMLLTVLFLDQFV